MESQVLEEFREGLCQGYPGTLLSYNHAGPHPRQVQPSRLNQMRKVKIDRLTSTVEMSRLQYELFSYLQSVCLQTQTFGAQLHDAVGTESVANFVLTDG